MITVYMMNQAFKFPKYIKIGEGYRLKVILKDLGKGKSGYIDFENKKIYCNRDNTVEDLYYHLLTIANKDAMGSNYYLQKPSKKQLKHLGMFLMKLLELNNILFIKGTQ